MRLGSRAARGQRELPVVMGDANPASSFAAPRELGRKSCHTNVVEALLRFLLVCGGHVLLHSAGMMVTSCGPTLGANRYRQTAPSSSSFVIVITSSYRTT